MKHQPRKQGPYVSKYLDLKAQIEELNAQLETVRRQEMDAEVVDIKKRILAFGIRPEQLYSGEDMKALRPAGAKRYREAPKYAHDGHTWSGRGNPPNWFREATKGGKTAESMLIAK